LTVPEYVAGTFGKPPTGIGPFVDWNVPTIEKWPDESTVIGPGMFPRAQQSATVAPELVTFIWARLPPQTPVGSGMGAVMEVELPQAGRRSASAKTEDRIVIFPF
jgi:hypothetical protein